MQSILNPDVILHAYQMGFFPMAESRDGEIFWHNPDPRAVFLLDNIKFRKDVIKKIKNGFFNFSIDRNFPEVINKCANRSETWINDEIIEIYTELHYMGFAHSVEAWHDNQLVGGLYGVSIGAAFFGESMFNTISDASKAAFYFLVHKLKNQNYLFLDSQYLNDFTQQLGAVEIPKQKYLNMLNMAINTYCEF